VVELMLVQPPRVLPRILAAVRVHDREVRTYALLNGYPLRLSKKFQTIVFRDDGTTEIKNSTDVETEALRSQERRVQDERIQHQMQRLEAQLRSRQAARSSTIASALVMIERNPREEAYDASGSESSEDTGFDLLSAPRDEFGMRIALNPTAATADTLRLANLQGNMLVPLHGSTAASSTERTQTHAQKTRAARAAARERLVVAFLTAVDGIDKHDADALREAVASEGCEAGTHNILFPLMDVGTGEIIQLISAVVSDGKEAVTINPLVASRYNVPQTYKQYLSCPHKAYWRTAMELKMESYEAIPVWNLVSIKAVPPRTRIFRLKWGRPGTRT
jgi:hypothetical protein